MFLEGKSTVSLVVYQFSSHSACTYPTASSNMTVQAYRPSMPEVCELLFWREHVNACGAMIFSGTLYFIPKAAHRLNNN